MEKQHSKPILISTRPAPRDGDFDDLENEDSLGLLSSSAGAGGNMRGGNGVLV